MAYTNFTNCTADEYTEILYSQDDKNRIRIWFNNVELTDAGEYCESLTGINRILPEDGSKRFSIDNFISKEYTLILRDLPDETIIADQVRISIGTLVDSANDTWEDVPIGIFNIQDNPETDKGKITIKLRDNRVKFDFGYNAKPLIDENGGKASYYQILNDICDKAGVTNDVSSFDGDNIQVGIYDNTITATNYVTYIAEQAGAIPVITREGHLEFIYLNDITTWKIPLDIVEKYEFGTPFEIERVVYESGVIKYETSNDTTLETLYLNASNPYISSQNQIDTVFDVLEDFRLDSVTTGKILGNPAIDAWDFIQVYGYYDENGNFVDDDSVIVFTTLANNSYTYNGVHRQTFSTTIGKEERKENVTIRSEATARKWAKTEIDNIEGTITATVAETQDLTRIVKGTYQLTEDETFQDGKIYYVLDGDNYVVYTDYIVGETIPANTIYELKNGIEETTEAYTNSQIKHSIDGIEASFSTTYSTKTELTNLDNSIKKYLRYVASDNRVELGDTESNIELRLKNNIVYFWDKTGGGLDTLSVDNPNVLAYFSDQKLYIKNAQILTQIQIGDFAFTPRPNGSLSFKKVV